MDEIFTGVTCITKCYDSAFKANLGVGWERGVFRPMNIIIGGLGLGRNKPVKALHVPFVTLRSIHSIKVI